MNLSTALNWVFISQYLSFCQPVCHSIGLFLSYVSVLYELYIREQSLLKQRTADVGSSRNKYSWFLNNLACSLINYPVKIINELVVQQLLCLSLGQKKPSMKQDWVCKVTVSLSNKSVDNLCFLRNYFSWEIYSFASCLAVMNLMFDLYWFKVDIILKQSLFVIWTSFMTILHHAIMIDFKNIARWKKLTW